MKNEELRKSTPVELEDSTLGNVSGGSLGGYGYCRDCGAAIIQSAGNYICSSCGRIYKLLTYCPDEIPCLNPEE